MKRVLIIVLLLVIAATAVVAAILLLKGPDLSQYESLRTPRLIVLPNQKMLVVTAKGDPNAVGGRAFKTLLTAFFKIKGVKMAAPRARWSGDEDSAKSEWIGSYALPVPEQTDAVPDAKVPAGMRIEVTTWEYGQVAEILHVGPYNEKRPTIDRLRAFIKHNGYAIAGPHEEEYLKGPGIFGPGNPKKYYTIIRYQVRTMAASDPKDTLVSADSGHAAR